MLEMFSVLKGHATGLTLNLFFCHHQITADPRFRLEQKLREAGLHNSSYARAVMATIEPLHAPRKDAASNIIFGNETKQ